MKAGGYLLNSAITKTAGMSPFVTAACFASSQTANAIYESPVNISSFCNVASQHAAAYFSNPVNVGLSIRGMTKTSNFTGAVAPEAIMANCAWSPPLVGFQNYNVGDIFLVGAVLILGVLSDRARAALRSMGVAIVDGSRDKVLAALRKRPLHKQTAAYHVAINLFPLFQIHEKLTQAGWKWYTDLPHQDRLYVLSCIAKGSTECFDEKGVSLSKRPKSITVGIEGRDHDKVKTVEIRGLKNDQDIRNSVIEQLSDKLSKRDWYSDWFWSRSHDERLSICSRIIESEGDLGIGDENITHISVIHWKPVIRIEYEGEVLEIESDKEPGIWSERSLMKMYKRRLEQVVKSREAIEMDDRSLAKWILASLIAGRIRSWVVHGPKKTADIFERVVAHMLMDDPAFKTIFPGSVITRVVKDIEKARS